MSPLSQSKQEALCCAAAEGMFDEVRDLLKDTTINVNSCGFDGYAALHYSCANDHRDIAELLLLHGADIDARSSFLESTPLMYACENGSFSTTELLLERGAFVHAKDTNGDTALHLACKYGNDASRRQIVKELLENGADPEEQNTKDKTPLDYGTIYERNDIVDVLARHPTSQEEEETEFTTVRETSFSRWEQKALCSAARYGIIDQIKGFLEDEFIDRNGSDSFGSNAFHEALQHACMYDHHDIAKLLLDHGVDIESTARKSEATPLTVSCSYGSVSTAKVLLDCGANVHAQDVWGDTPLHSACIPSDMYLGKQIAQELLAHGADPNVKNWNGETPLDVAKERGRNEIVDVLTRLQTDQEEEQTSDATVASSSDSASLVCLDDQTNLSTALTTQMEEFISKQVLSMEKRISANVDSIKVDIKQIHSSLKESLYSEVQNLLIESFSSLSDEIDTNISRCGEQHQAKPIASSVKESFDVQGTSAINKKVEKIASNSSTSKEVPLVHESYDQVAHASDLKNMIISTIVEGGDVLDTRIETILDRKLEHLVNDKVIGTVVTRELKNYLAD